MEFTLWTIGIILTFFLAFYTYYKYSKCDKEAKSGLERQNIITWAIFLILLGTANTMNILSRFIIQDQTIAMHVDVLSNYVIYFCWLVKVLPLERALRNYELLNTRYIFSSLIIALIIYVLIISPINLTLGVYIIIFIILSTTSTSFLPLSYLYFAIKTRNAQRREFLKVVAGVLILELGLTLQLTTMTVILTDMDLIIILSIISPIVIIVSLLVIFDSYRKSLQTNI